MNIIITNESLRADTTGGLIVDFGAEIDALPPTQGVDYVCASSSRLVGKSKAWETASPRNKFAEPLSIGSFSMAEGLEGVYFGEFVIKTPGRSHVALPRSLAFLLPAADAACRDALHIYGAKRFIGSSITLAARHQIVAPAAAQRPEAGGWHDHLNDGDRHKPHVDQVYCFTTAMSTEFLSADGAVKATKPGHMVRFGAEAIHRSPVNNTGSPLQRLWGVVVTHPNARPTNQDAVPLAYAEPNTDSFRAAVAAGKASLQGNSMHFTSHEATPVLG